MEFTYRYLGSSSVTSGSSATEMVFTPDTFREPTFFVADLAQHIVFREGISALHNVVVSDLRFKPKDREEYQQWLEQQEQKMLADTLTMEKEAAFKASEICAELALLNKECSDITRPYYQAQNKYFRYLLEHDYNAWIVLDPVITVHPDEVFFECFSKDESSYAKLSCKFDVFKNVSEFSCGTTNIDYSDDLFSEFQKIRTYKNTQFAIDPSGFEVNTEQEDSYVEQKIDLPDTWVRGFLQVSSAMTLPMASFKLHPMDLHNICFILRRQKERAGPRSIRFELTPGQPIKAIFEPWNTELVFKRSVYAGTTAETIRIWGRRRLLVLERLIPIAQSVTVHLSGSGLPSFFEVDLGDLTFTLGLSGWTANDWSRAGNFDLMAPRGSADEVTVEAVHSALAKTWFASEADLAQELKLERDTVLAALGLLVQAGRVIYDLKCQLYRLRELSKEPLPYDQLRFSNEREEKAANFVNANLATIDKIETANNALKVKGTVMDAATDYPVELTIDANQRLVRATCTCHYYVTHKLMRGPCEHMLALRQQHGKEQQVPTPTALKVVK